MRKSPKATPSWRSRVRLHFFRAAHARRLGHSLSPRPLTYQVTRLNLPRLFSASSRRRLRAARQKQADGPVDTSALPFRTRSADVLPQAFVRSVRKSLARSVPINRSLTRSLDPGRTRNENENENDLLRRLDPTTGPRTHSRIVHGWADRKCHPCDYSQTPQHIRETHLIS